MAHRASEQAHQFCRSAWLLAESQQRAEQVNISFMMPRMWLLSRPSIMLVRSCTRPPLPDVARSFVAGTICRQDSQAHSVDKTVTRDARATADVVSCQRFLVAAIMHKKSKGRLVPVASVMGPWP